MPIWRRESAHLRARLVERYDLPDALGTRTIVELAAQVR